MTGDDASSATLAKMARTPDAERRRLVTKLAWQIYRDSVVTERGLRPPQEAEAAAENWIEYVQAHHPEDAEELLREMAREGERQ